VEPWAVLASIGLLGVLSLVGALLGAERARALFGSAPLTLIWILVVALLAARLVQSRKAICSPGLLAAQLGGMMILLGAMYGSERGHRIVGRLSSRTKVPSGCMLIAEGEATDRIFDTDLNRDIGQLPFSVGLKRSWIEYYPPDNNVWELLAVAPSDGGNGQLTEPVRTVIGWTVGQDMPIPHIGASAKVMRYLDSARPVFAEGAEYLLQITQSDGSTMAIAAREGEHALLKYPEIELRIAQVFSDALLQDSGQQWRVIELPGSGQNPVLKVEIHRANGAEETFYVTARFCTRRRAHDGLILRLLPPKPIKAEADPTTGLPAMELLLSYRGEEAREWLIVPRGLRFGQLSLESLISGADQHAAASKGPSLLLLNPCGQIKAFKSDLVILEEGRVVAQKAVEVNQPLHYGGYHFYHYSYDARGGRYVVLMLSSDSGLGLAYAGVALLCLGVFWSCWVTPAAAALIGRNSTRGD